MFLPNTDGEFARAYLQARRSRVPREAMGSIERAGYFLLTSAARSQDGEMDTSIALTRALWAGEVEAAMAIFEGLLSPVDDVFVAGSNPARASASGEIVV